MTKAQSLLEEIKNPKKLLPTVRKKINSDLYPLTTKYHNKIPLADVVKILAKYGLIMLQEDNTEWSGLLVGETGTQQMIDIGYKETKNGEMYTPIENAALVLSWYKMPTGRYEVNFYIS